MHRMHNRALLLLPCCTYRDCLLDAALGRFGFGHRLRMGSSSHALDDQSRGFVRPVVVRGSAGVLTR